MTETAERTDEQAREDGWQNLLTMAGTRQDKARASRFHADKSLPREELEGLYATGGIARRIVDLPAQEMTRQWFELEMPDGERVMQAMEAVHIQAEVTWALQMGRLYGGSALLLLIDDGQDLEQPLNESGVREIVGTRVYDRHQITWTTGMLSEDPTSDRFGMPERYQISPLQGSPFHVHHSRLILFPGLPVPARLQQRNNYWDYSVLDPVYRALQDDAEAATSSAGIIQDFVQSVLSVKGLSDLLASGNEEVVKKRLQILDLSRHVLNTILLDADSEQYSKHASSVAGLSDLVDRLMMRISGITGIPMTKLWGRSPGGLNATGESDTRNYYDDLKGQQEQILQPRLERIVRLFLLAKQGPTRGREPSEWTIKWNPLWQPTAKELAETRKSVAETDAMYIDRGVLTPAEVAVSRFGQGEYSMETVIDPKAARNPTENGNGGE